MKKPTNNGAAAGTIVSIVDDLNPDEILARLSPNERPAALWRRTGIVAIFGEDYGRQLIAEASEQHIAKPEDPYYTLPHIVLRVPNCQTWRAGESALLSIRDFVRVALPYGSKGGLCMLTVYFDDSGTHDQSDTVLWAGLFGTQDQWDALSKAWRAKLQEPCPGKLPISSFHMTDCQAGNEEFLGWSRVETDFIASELTDLIIESGVYGYASAVSRNDWEELVVGDLLKVSGDAEGHCIRNCYVGALRWARTQSDPEIAFVFDNRPHRRAENERIFNIQKMDAEERQRSPELVSLTFASAKKFHPLQAADLFAWEYYQFANDILKGVAERGKPRRKAISKMDATTRFHLVLHTRKNIEEIVARAAPQAQYLAQLANFFEGED